jgi:hypothetical protein
MEREKKDSKEKRNPQRISVICRNTVLTVTGT